MKRSVILSGIVAAVLATGVSIDRADAAPIQMAPLAAATTSAESAMPVHYRGRAYRSYYRPGFAFYLGSPSYGPSCWWSHRYHRRVCGY